MFAPITQVLRATIPRAKLNENHEQIQASAGSSPGNGAILIATSTSNNVAVLRTFPEMVMSASETTGCCSASV
jgi:hypothetical protein